MTRPMLFLLLFGLSLPTPADAAPVSAVVERAGDVLYREMGLHGTLDSAVFVAGYESMERHRVKTRILAIADMSQPSTAQRLYVFDIEAKRLVLRTYVAHGQNSGGLLAQHFSNRDGSHQTSLGLYRVGAKITSGKHGPALLLHGLEPGRNDKARAREVIIHGADYVSEQFIAANGRLGRSWGCPAVPRELMPQVIDLLADDGLLYVYGR